MRLPILVCTCVLVTVAGGLSPAPAVDQPPYTLKGPGPDDWDCDAADGQIRLANALGESDHFKVTGILHVLKMHASRFEVGPEVAVGFDATVPSPHATYLQWAVVPNKTDEIKVFLTGDGRKTLASQPDKESEFPFMATLAHGIVTVTTVVSASGVPAKISAMSKYPHSDLNKVFLSCNGAHVRFSNVVVSTEP